MTPPPRRDQTFERGHKGRNERAAHGMQSKQFLDRLEARSAVLFHSVVLPSAVSSLARGTAISTRPKVPRSERDR